MSHLSVQEVIERPTKPVRPRKTSERMTIESKTNRTVLSSTFHA